MKNLLALTGAVLLSLAPCTSIGLAEEGVPAPWRSIKITAEPKPFKEVTVEAEIQGKGQSQTLKRLLVTHNGKALTLPKGALSGVMNPSLNSLKVLADGGSRGKFWLIIRMDLQMMKPGADRKTINFAFQDGKFLQRYTSRWQKDRGQVLEEQWPAPKKDADSSKK